MKVLGVGPRLGGQDLHVASNRHEVAAELQGPLAVGVVGRQESGSLPCLRDALETLSDGGAHLGLAWIAYVAHRSREVGGTYKERIDTIHCGNLLDVLHGLHGLDLHNVAYLRSGLSVVVWVGGTKVVHARQAHDSAYPSFAQTPH